MTSSPISAPLSPTPSTRPRLSYIPTSVAGGAAAGASAGRLVSTLTGASYSVLSGALAVNSSTGALTTTATAASSGSIPAHVRVQDSTNSTAEEITISCPIVTSLQALSLSATSFTPGLSPGTQLATISGQTSGSTISIASSDTSGVFAVSSDGAKLLAGLYYPISGSSTPTVKLVETLSGVVNSPRETDIAVTIAVTATTISGAVRLTDCDSIGAVATNNVFAYRVAEKTNAAGVNPWFEGFNGYVTAGSLEVGTGSLAQIKFALLTGITGTGLNQSGATATQATFNGIAGATGSESKKWAWIWDLTGNVKSYAQLVAAGGSVSSDKTALLLPSGWRWRCDQMTGVSLTPQQRFMIQYEEYKFAKQTITLSVSGTTVTATLGNTNYLAVGDSIVIAGSTNVTPGTYTITGLTSTTFTFTVGSGVTQGADTGTITANVAAHPVNLSQQVALGDVVRNDTTGGHTMTLDWTSIYNAGQQANGTLIGGPTQMYMTSNGGELCAAIHGDSIAAKTGDRSVLSASLGYLMGDADGVMGYVARWLNRQGYSFTRHAIPSTRAGISTTNYAQRGLGARFAACQLTEMGHNDGITSTLATYQGTMRPWWAMLFGLNSGCTVVQFDLTPTVNSSTDSFATRANQSIGNGPSSVQYTQIQPYVLAMSGQNGDATAGIDMNSIIQGADGTAAGSFDGGWAANGQACAGTVDGTHPSGGGAGVIANGLGALGQSYATSKLGFAPLSPRAATAPAQPLFVSAAAQSGAIRIMWSDSSDGGSPITARKLYRGSSSGAETLLATITNGNPIGFYVDSLGSNDTAYYKLSTVNSVGESALSAEVYATSSP